MKEGCEKYEIQYEIELVEEKEEIKETKIKVMGYGRILIMKGMDLKGIVEIEFGKVEEFSFSDCISDFAPKKLFRYVHFSDLDHIYITYYGSYKELLNFFKKLPEEVLNFVEKKTEEIARDIIQGRSLFFPHEVFTFTIQI